MSRPAATVELPGRLRGVRRAVRRPLVVAEEVARYAADVIVLEPAELREAVVASLSRVASLDARAEAVV